MNYLTKSNNVYIEITSSDNEYPFENLLDSNTEVSP